MHVNRVEIGRRIKEAITASKLNQKQLAAEIGVQPPSVTAYIKGEAKVPDEALAVISKLCNVSIDWLILGEVPERGPSISAVASDSHKPIAVSVNGGSAHIDVYHGPSIQEEIGPYDTSIDAVDLAFIRDWKSLSDVTKMRIWTLVKEEIEKSNQGGK